MRGRAGKSRRNIRHTIMDNAIFGEYRLFVRSDLRGLETASPVDTNVNNYTPRPHITDHLISDDDGRPAALRRKRADSYLAGLDLLGQNARLDHRGPHPLADIVLQSLQTVNTVVEDLDGSTQRQRRTGGELADDARTQYDDFGRRDAGDTTQQDTLPMVGRAQVLTRDQHHGTAGYLAHAAHNRVSAAVILEVFKRDTRYPFVHHLLQQFGLHGGKVDGGNDDLVEMQQRQVLLDDGSALHQNGRL